MSLRIRFASTASARGATTPADQTQGGKGEEGGADEIGGESREGGGRKGGLSSSSPFVSLSLTKVLHHVPAPHLLIVEQHARLGGKVAVALDNLRGRRGRGRRGGGRKGEMGGVVIQSVGRQQQSPG
jgi:hypothetical protein